MFFSINTPEYSKLSTGFEVLNRILDDMFHGESISQKKLKEVLGHSPLQVLAGAVLGVFIAILYAYKFGSGYASLSH